MTDDRGGKRTREGRVPPHNLEAEQAILGAAMLSPAAADAMVGTLNAVDFFKPAHQHIAAAVCLLMTEDEPRIDVVTVAEQIRKAGLLEDVGGIRYLAELTNATPSTTNAHRYARIVKDSAVLRRLISTAGEITELGYDSAHDPAAAVVRAGELLSRMDPGDAATLSTLDVGDVAGMLANGLQTEQPTMLVRSDGGALLYPGKMHVFQGEPGAGKTWYALFAVAEVLALGGSVAYLDFEDTLAGVLRRLLVLGVSPVVLAARFYYANPTGRFGPAERVDLARALDRLNVDLVVLDGVGESMSREGLSEDKADDVLRWTDLLPRPIARTGAAVLMLDHVGKDPEQRGRWARGSGAKLGVVDGVAYQVKVRRSFSRHREGFGELVIAKDRPGGVGAIGETAAVCTLTPHAAGERVVIRMDPHTAEQSSTDTWKPTVLMGKVWAALDSSHAPLTATGLAALVHSDKPRLVKEAIARLIAEGFIGETGGKRGKVLRTLRPYTDSPAAAAPAWREPPPPPELFEREDGPTDEDLAEIHAQREATDPDLYNHPEF